MKTITEKKNLETMSKAPNYNKWIFNNIKPYIGKEILEIGGGIGNMTKFFINQKLVVSTDIAEYNINKLKTNFKSRNNFFPIKTDISKTTSALKMFSFDTVICINVLEHIKNDFAALKNMNSILNKKGKLIIMVPAFTLLYGTIDKADSHYRRYNKKAIFKKIKKSGFKIIKCVYMNIPGFFGWYYHNRMIKAELHPEEDISFFDKIVPFFAFFEKIFKPPFGLSLIIIAEK